jgi:type II secretory pathway pseudopilin PulG
MSCSRRSAGVSLVEIVIALSVIAILVGALVPRVTNRMARSRDLRRLADVQTIVRAIERYRVEKGALPAARQNASYGGWDVSQDGDFIPDLVRGGYLTDTLHDPLDDETYNYRYFVYDAGTAGCACNGPFYVLGIRTFETVEVAQKHPGGFRCPERDFGDEFAWVTGGTGR